jgi:RNA polymerase sigma-70 factor, ECF subfamily
MNGTQVFDKNRPLLFAISYRMLGSVMEAEDVIQEAYWRGAAEEVRSPSAYLSTVVTRLCIDRLRSARARREPSNPSSGSGPCCSRPTNATAPRWAPP